MRRFRVPEILLGAIFGMIFGLFVADVTSFQAEHCKDDSSEHPSQEQPINSPNDRRDGDQKPSSYYQRHPISCGIGGTAPAAIGYMDENEGFFVGLFTGLLFVATVLLWRATNALWDAGEKQIAETRRIGEAQVRAYVSIKSAFIAFMAEWQHPCVGFVALNTGQSPAKNLVWNINVQYASGGQKQTTSFHQNWRKETGFDIPAATETIMQRAMIANIPLKVFREHPGGALVTSPRFVIVRVKIDVRYTDVFDRDWFGESYFSGIGPPPAGPEAPLEFPEKMEPLSPTPKPNDWDGPDT